MTKLMIDGYPHKVQNKYYKWYINIILNAIQRDTTNEYCETHHILPRSLGGSNIQQNLVKLTGREHYICHWLLVKFLVGDGKDLMLFAFHFMSYCSDNRYYTSRLYETQKIAHANAVSIMLKRFWECDEYKEHMRKSIRLSWSNGARNEQLAHMKENSPFKIKAVHLKTIENRTKNNTNIWVTNNPMKDPVKAKEIAKSRSGVNHYMSKSRAFYYRKLGDVEWIKIEGLLDDELVKLGFPRATFMKMIHGDYRPQRGTMSEYEVKRILNEDN